MAMLEHLPCIRINPAPLRPQPISRDMEERALRFELERQACQSLRQVLQLKLQQRRSREELINQGIMPPLKSSAAFHEQRRSLERARTEDYLKRKIRARPERSELIRMHILEELSAEPSLQAKQMQLKRARLADDLNDKISHRPGPMELIHKNILPVHSSIKQAIIETRFPKASADNSSCDEDSSYSLSPEEPLSQESPLGLNPLPSPPETLSSIPSPAQVCTPVPALTPISGSSPSFKLTNGTAALSAHRTGAPSHFKSHHKPSSDRSAQRHKKPKDSKPKIKKLKYHQYIPPDQKGDKEPPPHLDSSYTKILQQQQLFLQLQILSQQQQHYNYHAILPAPPKPQTDQQPSSSSSSSSTTSSPPRPVAASSTAANQSRQTSAPLTGTKPACLPPNLDEMKVAELKSELKLRSLTVSGTKNDLIERLRSYQELKGGADTSSSPTAGGPIGPGAGGAARAFRSAANNNKNTSQQQFQFQSHQMSALIADMPLQQLSLGGSVSPQDDPLTPSDLSPMSPDTGFNSDPLGEMMSSPLSPVNLQPCSAAPLAKHIKEEPLCSPPAPCQFSLKPASLRTHCPITAPAPAVNLDKDRLLHEKDRQIEDLTRLLRQNQRLVELLRLQLEHRSREGAEPLVLVRVKQEPPDKPSVPLSFRHTPSPLSREMVTVKQEATDSEESETTTQLPERTQEAQIKPQQMNTQTKQLLQQSTLQLAQQQAVQQLLLQQQRNIQNQQQLIQNRSQTAENLQKVSQQRKKKSHKQQIKQQQQQQHVLQSQQQHQSKQQQQHQQQQQQLKQQILLKQQKTLLQQQQSKQLQQIQIQTKIHVKQRQAAQVSQQPGSAPSFPLDLFKGDSTPTLVTDGNGNHFLIALTNHIAENQRTDAPESKATNHIALQRLQSTPAKLPSHNAVQQTNAENHCKQNVGFLKQQETKNGTPQESVVHQQDVSQCLSAPPSLKPFFKDQESSPSGKYSPPSQTELCPSLDVLFSPLSPASIWTSASSPDNKDTEPEEDFIDIILQTGEMSTTYKPAPDFSPHHIISPHPPSPLHLLLSPPAPPSCDTSQSELPAFDDTTEEKQHLGSARNGRLEDFLESTTGKPLLGGEPGGLMTLIDDLHSHMLCTPSILDRPLSPLDTFDMAAEGESGLDCMDWLDLTMGREREEETPTLAPLGPQTPPSVFCADFLDTYDLI